MPYKFKSGFYCGPECAVNPDKVEVTISDTFYHQLPNIVTTIAGLCIAYAVVEYVGEYTFFDEEDAEGNRPPEGVKVTPEYRVEGVHARVYATGEIRFMFSLRDIAEPGETDRFLITDGVPDTPPQRMKKFNHMFGIAFSIESENDGEHVSAEELKDGLAARLKNLCNSETEILEACGLPVDTYLQNDDDDIDSIESSTKPVGTKDETPLTKESRKHYAFLGGIMGDDQARLHYIGQFDDFVQARQTYESFLLSGESDESIKKLRAENSGAAIFIYKVISSDSPISIDLS